MAAASSNDVEKLQALRGMVDLLPEQTALWQRIEKTAQSHFKRGAVNEIRTPLLEATELFSRGIGEATDVVGKEMYSFLDRGQRNCTLRPEGTASVVRACIQHGLLSQGSQKFWYSGPMFRYERPQAGRQRQFHQIGVEFLGFDDPRSDIETIALAWDLLQDLGLKKINLELNSLGDLEDRILFRKSLVNWLSERVDLLDEDSKDRLNKNPLRILDSKNPKTQLLLKEAPTLNEALSSKSKERFDVVQAGLNQMGIPFQLNPCLVRGLDYYSHTAFEITSNELGAQATICGGGRYDGLVEQLGGPSSSGVGWALGMERLALLISTIKPTSENERAKFYVVSRGKKAETNALTIARNLRLKKHIVEIDLTRAAFSKQLKRADKSGAKWAIIIGDSEAEQRKMILKDMRCSNAEISKEELITEEILLNRFA